MYSGASRAAGSSRPNVRDAVAEEHIEVRLLAAGQWPDGAQLRAAVVGHVPNSARQRRQVRPPWPTRSARAARPVSHQHQVHRGHGSRFSYDRRQPLLEIRPQQADFPPVVGRAREPEASQKMHHVPRRRWRSCGGASAAGGDNPGWRNTPARRRPFPPTTGRWSNGGRAMTNPRPATVVARSRRRSFRATGRSRSWPARPWPPWAGPSA